MSANLLVMSGFVWLNIIITEECLSLPDRVQPAMEGHMERFLGIEGAGIVGSALSVRIARQWISEGRTQGLSVCHSGQG